MKQVSTLAAFIAGLAITTGCGGSDTGGAEDAAPAQEEAAPAAETPEPATETAPADGAEAAEAGSAQFAGFPAPYASADYARGKRIFKQCKTCHTLEEGGPTVLGPNLYGVFGREVGAMEGFSYSEPLQEADFTWTPEQLDQWLTNPRAFLPGNRMSFSGVRRPDDRTAVIAYIMSETGYEPS